MRVKSIVLAAIASFILATTGHAATTYDPYSYAGQVSLFASYPFGSSVLGSEFTAKADMTVSRLGIFDQGGNGLADSHWVGLWDSTGTLLSSVLVQSGTGSQLDRFNYRWESVAPVALTNGASYVIGALYTGAGLSDAFWFRASINPLFTPIENRLTPGGNLTYPSDSIGQDGFFGGNVAVTPIPSIAWLLGSGIVGLIGLKRKS